MFDSTREPSFAIWDEKHGREGLAKIAALPFYERRNPQSISPVDFYTKSPVIGALTCNCITGLSVAPESIEENLSPKYLFSLDRF